MRRHAFVLIALLPAACATRPQLVMINPSTGVTVGCDLPNTQGDSGEFLVSRACISACEAHGFRPVPGVQTTGGGDSTPQICEK